MMVIMVVEEKESNAFGLIKIKSKEFTNQNIYGLKKIGYFLYHCIWKWYSHKEMPFIKLYFAKIMFNPLPTKDL